MSRKRLILGFLVLATSVLAANATLVAVVSAAAPPNISAPPDVIVGEADGHVDLPVTLSAPGTSTVTVNYATANSTAGSGTACNNTYVGVSGTLTFTPGVTTQSVPVDLNNCHLTGFRSFTFNLSSPTNAAIIRPGARIGIVGDSNTTATPLLYARDAVVDNSAGTVNVPVLLGGTAGSVSVSTVTVAYATANGTAVAGSDYTATSGTLTFAPGQTVANVAIPIINRAGAASSRRFTLVLSAPTNAVIAHGAAVVVIGASGATPVASPNISAPADLIVGSADGYVDLPVTLSAPGTSTVTVNYATANSTATSGVCNNNYISVSGTLTFTPGVTTQAVRVDINNCNLAGFRSFTFNLSVPTNATIIRPGARIGIVGDSNTTATPLLYARDAVVDNGAGTVNVPVLLGGTAGSVSASTVTVAYATANGTAVAGSDYTATSGTLTFAPGQTVANIAIPIINRAGAASSRRFALVLSAPTNAVIAHGAAVVVIGANGATPVASPNISAPADLIVGSADGYVDLPVTLSAPGTSTVTVNYATANSTAGSGTACNNTYVGVSGTLTFTPGVTTQAVRVDLNNCPLLAGFRSFTFNLSLPTNAVIIRPGARIGIVGDSNTTATPLLYARDAVVDNGAGTVNVPVLLGGTAGSVSVSTVTVAYATVDGTAVAGSDYTASSGTLTFAPGQTVANVAIPIINRAGAASSRSFTLVLIHPTNAAIAEQSAVVVIGASGATPAASPNISAPADVIVGEADGYVDLPVTLSAPGTSAVTVNYASVNGTATSGTACNNTYVGVSGTLTFTPGVTTQVVRVDLNNCNLAGSQTFTFNLSLPVNATILRPSATITIGQYSPRVDTDGDGYVDTQEVALGKDPLTYCAIMRADVDGDGAVSILDLTKVAQYFTQSVPPAPARYDQDGDGKISILDLTHMAQVFTQHVTACP